MLKGLFTSVLCLLMAGIVRDASCQRSRFPSFDRSVPVDVQTVLKQITDRTSIQSTEAGLKSTLSVRVEVSRRSGAGGRSVLDGVTAQARSASKQVDDDKLTVSAREPTASRRSFPFGPHLLTGVEAQRIGRQGRTFDEATAEVARRLQLSGKEVVGLRDLPSFRPPGLDCPFSPLLNCDTNTEYRTIDGSCNNLQNPYWGRANTPFERFIAPFYEDGVKEPRQTSVLSFPLPEPRTISIDVHKASQSHDLSAIYTHLVMEYGQFMSHDTERTALTKGYGNTELICCNSDGTIDTSPEKARIGCLPIKIPKNDPYYYGKFKRTCMEFVRALSTPNLNCNLGNREHLNQETCYVDGSAIYGSSDELNQELRKYSGGLLKSTPSSDGELLLQDPSLTVSGQCVTTSNQHCFKAGDERANQQPALMSIHTLWLREHNRVARNLSKNNPSWNDEKLFQVARKIVSAELQHVTYNEFLPTLVGDSIARAFDFPARPSGYHTDYNPRINAQIRSGFAAAAYRFGHSLVHTTFATNHEFKQHFLKPGVLYDPAKGPSFVLKSLYQSNMQKFDSLVSPTLTTHLFETIPGIGIDLAATNIQRGRDFGLPGYNLFRVICGLSPVGHFRSSAGGLVDHDPAVAALLGKVYRHVDDIDLWTGAVSEKRIYGAVVGPTVACIVGRQFFLMKKGDRFFYETNDKTTGFPERQLDEIRKTSLARIICDNTKANNVQADVFKYQSFTNPVRSCSSLPSVDLTKWGNGGCIDGGWSGWFPFTQCYSGYRFRFRICNNPKPSNCGRPCQGSSFWAVRCNNKLPFIGVKQPSQNEIKAIARGVAPAGVILS